MVKKSKIKWITVLPACLCTVIAIRLLAGEICAVPSSSMSPAIVAGDRLWIDKLTYGARLPGRFADIPVVNIFTWIKPFRLADQKRDWGYHRMKGVRMPQVGDLAVFELPDYPHPLVVKRIASSIITGDTVIVNSQNYDAIHKIIMNEGNDIFITNDSIFINGRHDSLCIVSQPYYYMLGDNRDQSLDSRIFGYVPYSAVVGRMNVVLFSINPDYKFIQRIRWDRFFRLIA